MLDNLIHYTTTENIESFHLTINKFKWKWLKKLIINLMFYRIFQLQECTTMYNSKEHVRKCIINKMQLNYLYN